MKLIKPIAITAVSVLALTVGACGSSNAEPEQVDVIAQIEEKCGLQSKRGKKLEFYWWNKDDASEYQCVINAMPDEVYEQYEKDKEEAESKESYDSAFKDGNYGYVKSEVGIGVGV